MAKNRKTQEEINREAKAKERQQKLQAEADARKEARAKRASETIAEQRERLARERVERDRTRQERAQRARSERQRLQQERENRRTEATQQVAIERERERLARQVEADKRKWEADQERTQRRFVNAGWAPALIESTTGAGKFTAFLNGGAEVNFTEAREASSPHWITLVTDKGEEQVRLANIQRVRGQVNQKHEMPTTKAMRALAEAEAGEAARPSGGPKGVVPQPGPEPTEPKSSPAPAPDGGNA